MSMEREEGRAEIDTRAPFRSVKEAVALFGERVLAGEVYANKLKEMRVAASYGPSRLDTVTVELEETKESLKKTKEEGLLMANCLTSVKEELEQTKREIQELKAMESHIDSEIEIEDLKFVENATEVQRYVKFADMPSLAQVMAAESDTALEKRHSLNKKKKKPLILLIGEIFSKKKKGFQEIPSPKAQAS